MLKRADRIRLDVRVQKAATVAHVLERDLRTNGNLCEMFDQMVQANASIGDCLYAPRGLFLKSLPSRFAWKRELICESPDPEWFRIKKWSLNDIIYTRAGTTMRQRILASQCLT